MERRIQINQPHISRLCHTANGPLDSRMPITSATLETRMTMPDRRHQTNPNLRLRIRHTERVNQCEIVGNKIVGIIRPVARVRIVQAEMNHHHVSLKSQSITKLLLVHIRTMSTTKQCRTRMAEIAHIVSIAQQLLQLHRISLRLTLGKSVTISYAIAHTSHTNQRSLSQSNPVFGCYERNSQRKQEHQEKLLSNRFHG